MAKKILFCTGEGIGNVIQTIPTIRTLKEVLGYEVDMWYAFGAFSIPHIIPYVDRWFMNVNIIKADPNEYEGLVSTFWTRNHIKALPQYKRLNEIIPLRMDRSEVDIYMDIARELGAPEEDLIWHGTCRYNKTDEKYDVVVSDGYNRQGSANWSIKHYPYYKEVITLLKEKSLDICSLGASGEHISGTVDRTGLNLLDSLGIIANSKLVLSNDSGLYHAANALGIKNLVIFTATSIEKNFDSRFHKFSTIIGRDDLDCRPCQAGRGWKNCKTWKCREIDPKIVVKKIEELL